ncbi:MAG: peptidylprolyl isomerase [Acidimicrobiales bacterium]
MPSEKRARQRALRAEKQAVQQQARKRRQNLRRVVWAAILVAVVVVVAVLSATGSTKKAGKTTTTTTLASSATSTSSTTASTTSTVPPTTFAPPTTQPLQTTAITPVCPPTTGATTREVYFKSKPPNCISTTSVWDATFYTSVGNFVVQMDAAKSYAGVNNFVFLALYKYYDGTFFHRIVPGFVIQGGDPTGLGTGGSLGYPGYSFTGNTPPASCKTKATSACYQTGAFVYANSTGPSTNGSQFFVVLPGGASQLNTEPNYTIFGKVISGMSVCEKVASYPVADSSTGAPSVKVYVTNVTIKKV